MSFIKFFIFAAVILFISFSIFFIVAITRSDANPPWGPLFSEQKANFSIQKPKDDYVIAYTYKGKNGIITVGKSLVELETYIGKQVRIDGKYLAADAPRAQCIVSACHPVAENASEHLGYVVSVETVR